MQAVGAASGDGAITDGVSSSIKATVFDYSNANPLAVVLRDTNGDYVAVGGGTQYTEDDAAAANPVGTVVNLIRQDTPSAITSTDGDNIAQRGTNYGAGYVQIVTSSGTFVDTFGGGTQYTEDDAAAANPTGTALMLVRADSPSAVTSTDGDNIASRGTNKGELYVKHLDTIAVSGTVAVSSSALPTGAATSAKQDSEIALLTTIDADTSTLAAVDFATGADVAALGVVGGGAEATALRVTIANDSSGTVAVTQSGTWTEANSAAIAASLSVLDDWDETNRAAVNIIAGQVGVQGGSGSVNALTQRVVLATDVALPAGTNAIGKLAANSGVDIGDVDVTSIAAGTNTIGGVVPVASASSTGLLVNKTDAQTATVTAVKAAAGRVYGYHVYNPNSADAFLHFYNIASGSVTVGTSTRKRTLWIPAGGAIDTVFTIPIEFDTAISTAATTTITGSSAPSTGLLVDVDYL